MSFWIQTYKGNKFDFCHLSENVIDIEDIAHALSNLCRFNGHTKRFYSVAQHSVILSKLVPESIAFYGLIHDSAEAYIGDLSTPLKAYLQEDINNSFRYLERDILSTIFETFGLDKELPSEIKIIDKKLLLTERNEFFDQRIPYLLIESKLTPIPNLSITPLDPIKAELLFLSRFEWLYIKAKRLNDENRNS